MPTADVTVLLKAADGGWTSVGRDIARGIVPESVSVSANESGPDTCSFVLKRRASVPWPDLLAFNQAEIQVGGIPVWGGRVWEAPISDAAEDSIAVSGRGWQYHLDDDMYRRFYVKSGLGEWRDHRTFATANLGFYNTVGEVVNDRGAITLIWKAGNTVLGFDRIGVTIDFGAASNGAKRIVIEYETSANSAVNSLFARNHNLESEYDSGSSSDAISGITLNTLGASGTEEGTFTTRYRYCTLLMFRSDASSGTILADHWIRFKAIRVFAATAYESGGASVLNADTVIKDARDAAAPLLSTSNELIESASFDIPELSPDGYQTPRAVMAAANAYEGNLFGVDAQRKVFFRERATEPRIEIGEWSGADFQDATTGSAEGLYNRVIVQGTGPDGAQVERIRTATSSLLTRQGFTRSAVLQVASPVTTTAADQIGDLWLAEKATPPMKGTITVKGQGGCRLIGGGSIHPSELLLYVGERIRLTQLPDPESGAWGRDVTIKAASYSHDTETATVELDNERGNLSTLLARFQVTTSQVLR